MKLSRLISVGLILTMIIGQIIADNDDYDYDDDDEYNPCQSDDAASQFPPTCGLQKERHTKDDKYTVFINESENNNFVKEFFASRPQTWEIVYKTSQRSDLDMIITNESINWKVYNDHLLINLWPLSNQFYNKAYFYKNAERLHKTQQIKELSLHDVTPPTYFIDMTQPKLTDEEKEFFRVHKSGVWIKKPVEDHRCKGIEVFKDLKVFQQKVGKNKPFKKQNYPNDKKSWIVQKYIENSLLIQGRKFDIRCFVLIASFDPYVMLYYPGYIRRSLEQFSLLDLDNKFIHCVNQSVQMKHKQYEQRKQETIWTMDQFEDWLRQNNQDPKVIEERIKKRVAYSGLGQKDFVHKEKEKLHKNKFQIFGVDISFNDEFNPFVIEFNQDIYLSEYHISVLDDLFKQVSFSMMQIEQNHLKYNKIPNFYFSSYEFIDDLGNFTILYNEATNYSIIQ